MKRSLAALPAALAGLAIFNTALGQDQADSTTVVITGSRTATTEKKSLAPVQVVSGEALAETGYPDLKSALAELVPAYENIAYNGSSSSKPVRTATLRGLSGNQVLVLINGHRRHNTALLNNTSGPSSGAAPVDLALIPTASVERVEVLLDGASAQYGSDAIAGVINIILKSNSSGGVADVESGQYNRDAAEVGGLGQDGRTTDGNFEEGFKLGPEAGFLNVTAEFRDVGTSNIVGPLEPPTKSAWQIYAALDDPREATADRYRQWDEVVPPGDTSNLGYNLELPFTDHVKLYSNATASYSETESDGTYRSETNPAVIVDVSPPGGYLPILKTRQEDFQENIGVKGDDLLGWDWDASASYGRNRSWMNVLNGTNASFGGTVPPQTFYIGALVAGEGLADLDVKRPLSTSLFADPLNVAAGIEYRSDSFAEDPGAYYSYADGGYVFPADYPAVNLRGEAAAIGAPFMSGFTPAESGSWGRNDEAAYLELSQKLTPQWTMDLAGRFEDYSDFGGAVAGKFSTRYEILPGLAFRGTLNNGFRAPSLAEEYTTVANQGPQANPLAPGTYFQLNSYNSIRYTDPAAAALGAQPLKPEKSVNSSVGLVATPAPRTNVSLDVYQIDITNRIYLTGAFDGVTSAAVRDVLEAAGQFPYQSIQYFANIGDTRSRGVDFQADYSTNVHAWGEIKWTLTYSLNDQQVTKVNPAPPQLAAAGLELLQRPSLINIEDGLPKDIAKVAETWRLGPFEATLVDTYYSRTRMANSTFPDDPAYDSVSSPAIITDASVSYWIQERFKVTLGALNLTNKYANNVPAIAVPYITSGYTYPAPISNSPWGTGGAFYYARLEYDW